MTPWRCSRCSEDQVAFGRLPADLLCDTCHEAQRKRFSEADRRPTRESPERYRGLTREGWTAHFQRPWPAALERWTGSPHWVALWGPTGTGKTGLATVLLAEHLRTGRRGRWVSGPERCDFASAEDVIAPLLPLLSRWLSGLRIHDELAGEDVRLRGML